MNHYLQKKKRKGTINGSSSILSSSLLTSYCKTSDTTIRSSNFDRDITTISSDHELLCKNTPLSSIIVEPPPGPSRRNNYINNDKEEDDQSFSTRNPSIRTLPSSQKSSIFSYNE